MSNKFDFIDKELLNIKENNLLRIQNTFSTGQRPFSKINNVNMLLFFSSNYLSYSENADIIKRSYELVNLYGLGSGGSRLTSGNSELHEMLENKLSEFTKYESSLLFNSGYTANLGVISALLDENSIVFSDIKNHASIIDGCRLSKAKIVVYNHNDMKDLESKLSKNINKRKLIISDGVFSMGGDILQLDKFVELGNTYNALSIVDDAHGIGVLGENGRGILEHYKFKYFPDLLVGSLSKGIGVEGGFVSTSSKLKKFLIHKARPYIFSTSLSPFVVSSSYYVIEDLLKSNKRVKKLQENVSFLVKELNKVGFEVYSQTPIITIKIGDENIAERIFSELMKCNIHAPIIRFPAVRKKEAILRISLMSDHREEDLKYLVKILKILKEKYKL